MLANGTRRHVRQPSIDARLVKRVGAVRDLPRVVPALEFFQAHVARVAMVLELAHGVLRVEGPEHGASLDAFGRGASVSARPAAVDLGPGEPQLVQQLVHRHAIYPLVGGGPSADAVGREHLQEHPSIDGVQLIEIRTVRYLSPSPRSTPPGVPNDHPLASSARVARHGHGRAAPRRARIARGRERDERTTPDVVVGGGGSIAAAVAWTVASQASFLEILEPAHEGGGAPPHESPRHAAEDRPHEGPSNDVAHGFCLRVDIRDVNDLESLVCVRVIAVVI